MQAVLPSCGGAQLQDSHRRTTCQKGVLHWSRQLQAPHPASTKRLGPRAKVANFTPQSTRRPVCILKKIVLRRAKRGLQGRSHGQVAVHLQNCCQFWVCPAPPPPPPFLANIAAGLPFVLVSDAFEDLQLCNNRLGSRWEHSAIKSKTLTHATVLNLATVFVLVKAYVG